MEERGGPLSSIASPSARNPVFLPLRRLRRAQRVPGASPSVAGPWSLGLRRLLRRVQRVPGPASRTESRSEQGGLAGLNLMLTSLRGPWRLPEGAQHTCPQRGPWRLPEAEPGEKVKASGHLAKYGKKRAPPLLSLIRQVPGSRGAPGGCRRQSQGRKSKLPATWRSTESRGLPPFLHSFGKCPEALLLLACIVEDQRVRW